MNFRYFKLSKIMSFAKVLKNRRRRFERNLRREFKDILNKMLENFKYSLNSIIFDENNVKNN